jgi:toxin ParE1/3/4
LEACDWYESKRAGLGLEFFSSIESSFSIIQKTPFLFAIKIKNVRCAFVPHFPYGIFYFIDNDRIVVIAVFHLSRNPRLWKKTSP